LVQRPAHQASRCNRRRACPARLLFTAAKREPWSATSNQASTPSWIRSRIARRLAELPTGRRLGDREGCRSCSGFARPA